MSDCLFCKIISGLIPCEKVFEDEHTFAFLDIKPLHDGHTLVVPKAHHENILVAPQEALGAIMNTVHKLAPAIRDAVGADGINIGINNGSAAGQVVFHLHAHIIPRFAGDGYHHWTRVADGIKPLAETQKKILTTLGI